MNYFSGKTIWITGASSGIGEATAQALAQANASLILSARRTEELERVQQLCAHSEKVKILPLDLEHHEQAHEWVNSAWELFGGIDILINNGGIGQYSLALETKSEVERKIMDINFFGNIALSKALLPKMLAAKQGQILAIGSIAANFGQSHLAAYSASKAALKLYYESLREELIHTPIRIQVVSPGFINTQVSVNALRADGTKVNKNSSAQENGMPTSVFAKKLLKVLQSKRFHSYIGNKELLAVPLHTLVPSVFYKLIRKDK
jgi:short-subunit dehydrogenase